MKVLYFLALFAILTFAQASNPGLVVSISEEYLESYQNAFFPAFIKHYGTIQLEDLSDADVRIPDTHTRAVNDDPENFEFSLNAEDNSITAKIKNTVFTATAGFATRDDQSRLEGLAEFDFLLQKFSLTAKFDKISAGDVFVPQVFIPEPELTYSLDSVNVNVAWDDCKQEDEEYISEILKEALINKLLSSLVGEFSESFENEINDFFEAYFPPTTSVGEDFSILTGLTDAIKVHHDHVEIPIDVIFYENARGIVRPESVQEMPHFNPDSPHHVQVFLNPHLAESFSKILVRAEQMELPFSTRFFEGVATVDFSEGSSISFTDGGLLLKVNPKFNLAKPHLTIDAGLLLKLNFDIKPFNSFVLLMLEPQISGVDFDILKVIRNEQTYDFGYFKFLIRPLVNLGLYFFKLPQVPFLSIDKVPNVLENSQFEFTEEFAHLGLKFAFE